ncbi:hypothetical protein M0M44_11010 [Flavobacterium humidisoli]|uniref:Uncharacterized protein n=1 Tax=Flavobacterium humidisoli TaxID=2937442 RepID=A0ABY4LXN3_9FLAO|nr:hypothetical protein [Flavobacterium humidisoli]UPZ17855.1 hypothetical protein M0M44_11010 [Flavobacterium humidisoli]
MEFPELQTKYSEQHFWQPDMECGLREISLMRG